MRYSHLKYNFHLLGIFQGSSRNRIYMSCIFSFVRSRLCELNMVKSRDKYIYPKVKTVPQQSSNLINFCVCSEVFQFSITRGISSFISSVVVNCHSFPFWPAMKKRETTFPFFAIRGNFCIMRHTIHTQK